MSFSPQEAVARLCAEARSLRNEDPVNVLRGAPTMLSNEEVHLLTLLVTEYLSGEGNVAELGTYLGGSAVALGSALQSRTDLSHVRIETFDRFDHPPIPRFGVERSAEQRELWEKNVASVRHIIDLFAGDLTAYQRESGDPQIELLFVDVVKQPKVVNALIEQFYQSLVPGRSLVIHQDYFHYGSPWVVYTTELLREHFTYCGQVGRSSAVFLFEVPLSNADLRRDWVDGVSMVDKFVAMEVVAQAFDHTLHASIKTAQVMLLLEDNPFAARALHSALTQRYNDNARIVRYLGHLRKMLSDADQLGATGVST